MSFINEYCDCSDMDMLLNRNSVVVENSDGWVLSWVEVIKEQGDFKRVNKYGIYIYYCPICGKKLRKIKKNVDII